jgi:hypothetical protein
MSGLNLLDSSLTSLPLHGQVVRGTSWKLSNLTYHSVPIELRECSVIINIELEVEKGITKLGVDKLHLILVEVLD